MSIRENKFARQADRRKDQNARTGNVGRDQQSPVDDQLTRLEEDLRRLKVEYDIYFNGASKRPPHDTKSRVESFIKRIADDRTLTFAQRYRYNSLVARHTAFREQWRRTTQEREDGRDVAAAARERSRIEATQHKQHPAPAKHFVCDDARHDVQTIKNLYDTLVEAKRNCGEPVEDLSFPRFHRLMASKTDALKERLACDRVRFSVTVEDGAVSLKAKAGDE